MIGTLSCRRVCFFSPTYHQRAASVKKTSTMAMEMRTTAVTFRAMLFCAVGTIPAMATPIPKQPPVPKCDEFYYYDHGTELCEHCRDICDDASAKKTVEVCWRQCHSYALALWPPKESPIPEPDETGNQESNDTSFPLAAKITIPVVCLMLLGMAVGLAIIRRKIKKNQQGRAPAGGENENETTTVLISGTGESESAATGASLRATLGTSVTTSPAGVQGEAASFGQEGGQRVGRGSTVAQATPSHLDNLPAHLCNPVPVSPEGNCASFALALPASPLPVMHIPPLGPQSRHLSLPSEDLDSTELKTLLPSLSNDSLLVETRALQGGDPTTAAVSRV
ncbi:uncharacterized protein LOC143292553 [Babylonia areolata]|uniref:uncharacterized protein LOC143292553 n=1 Tax=Babylonia areolata TaxID=304850 RepID=UPI003FD45C2B